LNKHTILFLGIILISALSCGKKSEPSPKSEDSNAVAIGSSDEFTKILESSRNKLLVFDLYADWCVPCRILSPIFNELAKIHNDKALFYRIDVDRHPDIAQAFGTRGIPYVVFVKNKEPVYALTGVNSKESYERVILACGSEIPVSECREKLAAQ